jgi:hypothetical protein
LRAAVAGAVVAGAAGLVVDTGGFEVCGEAAGFEDVVCANATIGTRARRIASRFIDSD